jgi:hypothetical protein
VDEVETVTDARRRSKPDSLGFLKPRVHDRSGARLERPDAMQPGLTLLTTRWREDGEWTAGAKLIDRRGEVLHTWEVHPEEIFEPGHLRRQLVELPDAPLHGTHLFPESGDLLVNVEYAGVVRLDACGEVVAATAGGNHHSIHPDDDGSFWTPALSQGREPETSAYPNGFPGLHGELYHGLAMNLGPADSVRATINMLNVLYDNDLGRYIVEAGQQHSTDPLHINDVEPLPDTLAADYPLFEAGDLLVSLRNLDLVLVVDPETRSVKWHRRGGMQHQHDPDWMGDGWIGIFDNRTDGTRRGRMLGGSRVVAVQPHTDSTTVLYPTSRSERFYTYHRGKWQQLENGNLLLTEEEAARAVEVAPDGSTVWEWIHAPAGDGRVPSVTKATRVEMRPRAVAQWPCSPGDSVITVEQ